MKNIIGVLMLLSLFACKSEKTEQSEVVEKAAATCTAADFLELKNEALQTDFFAQLDAITKTQNLDATEEIFRDITPELLQTLLSDATKGGFAESKTFEKDYNFNLAPSDFKDSEKCMDKMSVTFDESTCTFKVVIFNSFSIDGEECAESMASLGFKIKDGKIVDFTRDIAG